MEVGLCARLRQQVGELPRRHAAGSQHGPRRAGARGVWSITLYSMRPTNGALRRGMYMRIVAQPCGRGAEAHAVTGGWFMGQHARVAG